MGTPWRVEVGVYGALCLAALAVIRPSLTLGLGSARELGPGLLPFIAALVVLATGLPLMVQTLIRRKRALRAAAGEGPDRGGGIRVLVLVVALLGWPVLSSAVGYVIPTFLVSLCVAKATGYPGWRGPALLSACVALALWVIFSRVFSTDLPGGVLF